MEKRLIINADDYGHTRGISAGIRQAHLNGIVTSTSVMMNRPGALEDVEAARHECPQLGIGIHLVLTVGKPLLPAEQLPSLVDQNGLFYDEAGFLARLDKINPAEALLEWRAQINLLTNSGLFPDHLDSHHHSSYFTPALLENMLSLAMELNCPIRNPYGERPADFAHYLSKETAGMFEHEVNALQQRYHPRTAQVFLGNFYDAGATAENLKNILKQISNDPLHDSFELMCHPAVVDQDLQNISDYCEPRGRELSLLQEPEFTQLLKQYGIRLISYSDL